jgi:hypothetical protein
METKPAKSSKSSQPDRPKYAWICNDGVDIVGGGWKQSWDSEFERVHLDYRQVGQGVRLPDISVPLALENRKARGFPHVFCILDLLYVSDSFKKIVEQYEPDVHNFIPVALTSKSTTERYFILNYTQKIRAERYDLSQLNYIDHSQGGKIPVAPHLDDMLTIDGKLTEGKHLWAGRWWPTFYLSDQVYQEFVKLKRRNCFCHRVKIIY